MDVAGSIYSQLRSEANELLLGDYDDPEGFSEAMGERERLLEIAAQMSGLRLHAMRYKNVMEELVKTYEQWKLDSSTASSEAIARHMLIVALCNLYQRHKKRRRQRRTDNTHV